MIWFWLACSTPSPQQVALDPAVSLDQAIAGCETLKTPVSQGQCTLDALNVRGAITVERCATVAGERWRSECLFQAAEASTGSLKERYAICSQTGDYERDCGFHLWQKALLDLAPGKPGQDGVLIRAGQLLRQHRPYAEKLDYSFEETFWTWFWGAWWEQQPAAKPGDTSACLAWSESGERARCEEWADRGRKWLQEREKGQPR